MAHGERYAAIFSRRLLLPLLSIAMRRYQAFYSLRANNSTTLRREVLYRHKKTTRISCGFAYQWYLIYYSAEVSSVVASAAPSVTSSSSSSSIAAAPPFIAFLDILTAATTALSGCINVYASFLRAAT